jgi:hypothetical protein
MLPDFNKLDITQYPIRWGYYTLGLFEHFRPDIEFIYIRMDNHAPDFVDHDLEKYDWLEEKIESGLSNKKIVCIIPWDEHVVFLRNTQLETILNKYTNDPVYWITNLESSASDVYTTKHVWQNYHLLQIKIIELPWWLLNDCLTYYRVADTKPNEFHYDKNYLSMVGNAWYPHKFQVIRDLKKYNLIQYGINTASKTSDIPLDLSDTCELNPIPPYTDWNPNYSKMAAQKQVNGIWISSNVENYLKISEYYPSIPLVINAETIMLKLFATEKSIWPILLGRMFLIYGRPKILQYVQRFYDIDINKFSNTDYDTIDGYSKKNQLDRLDCLISKNKELIKNSSDLHCELQAQLEDARWTFGANMYRYFVEQISKIV